MRVDDAATRAEFTDRFKYVPGAACHLGECADAQQKTPVRAGDDLLCALVAFHVDEQPRDARKAWQGRIIRVQRHGHAVFLAHGDHALHEVGEVCPQRFHIRDLHIPPLAEVCHVVDTLLLQCQIKGLHLCAVASHRRVVVRAPDEGRGKVVAQHRNANAAQIADGFADVFNLLIPSGQAQHGLVVKADGQVLHGLHRYAVCVATRFEICKILIRPMGLAGQIIGQVELNAVYAHLAGVHHRLPVYCLDLAVCQSHHRAFLLSSTGGPGIFLRSTHP